MKKILLSLSVALVSLAFSNQAQAHCQVPCGIYGDDRVLAEMAEDVATVTKAMAQIKELSADGHKNMNQIVRWVTNKEKHAQHIQDTVQQYFLAQRVKLDEADSNAEAYTKKLVLLHQIIVYSMKCKQSTDAANAEALQKAIDQFSVEYKKH